MALSNSLMRFKDKVTSAVNNFFYPRNEYPEDERVSGRRGGFGGRSRARGAGENEREIENGGWGEPGADPYGMNGGAFTPPAPQVSSPYQGTNPYTAPQQPAQAQASRPAWQQGMGGWQAPQQAAPQQPAPQQTAPQQPAPQPRDNLVYFPSQEAAPSPEAESAVAARVINARTVSDCYSAITQLRLGDVVVLVMDSITDPAEMRHYVDMLSGACYSLRATITKLSRHGAYLICPSRVRVFVDAATNQLNSTARQPQRPLQNPYGQVRGGEYAASYPPYQQPYPQQEPNRGPFDQGPVSRSGGMEYYGRSAMPDAAGTADHLQPYANGYMPDAPGMREESRAL